MRSSAVSMLSAVCASMGWSARPTSAGTVEALAALRQNDRGHRPKGAAQHHGAATSATGTVAARAMASTITPRAHPAKLT